MVEMSSRERMDAALHFRECDRVPVFPLYHYSSTRVSGILIGKYATDAETMAESLIAAFKFMEIDGVSTGADVSIEGEACGSIVHQPKDEPAYLLEPVIKKHSDLDCLEVPDPDKAGRMPVIIKATNICKKTIGNEAYIEACVMGPMNLASQLRGVENLMFDIIEEPGFFNRLLDFSLNVSLRFAKRLIDAGADQILAGEALCSPNFISPSIYKEHIQPRQKIWVQTLKEYGANSTLIHVCGDISTILEGLGATGTTCLDVDSNTSMALAKKKSGCAVRGNIDPSAVLLKGTEEDVKIAAKAVLDEAKDGYGMLLGSGCDVSPATPLENVKMLVTASKLYGRYS